MNYLTIGTLIAFYSFIGYLFGPIIRLMEVNTVIEWVMVSIDRIFGVLDEPVKIREKRGALRLDNIKGNIIFDGVSFSYKDDGRQILNVINLEIKPHEKVAIVGPSGSGKSTLIKLIPRFYDTTKGRVLIDGHDVRDVRLASLRGNIGLVPQEITVFSGTIYSNIQYGWKKATHKNIVEAARKAHLEEFIETLPDGYNTMIGEKGIGLSGGQKQRLSIARVLVRNPQVLLLDDYSSALDTTTEMHIRKMLEELTRYVTCIIVSHRLSSVIKADRIIAIEDGQIVEQGSHTELLKRDGYYARLYYEQTRGVNLGIIK
jgi:subfamily B ATP-binding cassette protein MsbA